MHTLFRPAAAKCRALPRSLARLGATLGLAAATLLTACGGGGGGETGSGGSALSFGALTPATLSFDVPEGVNLPWVSVSSVVGGDVAQLNGKTIHVLVDDPLAVFERAELAWDAASSRATISLAGRTLTQAGQFNGRIGLRVCADAACQQPLTTAPLGFDLSVRVRAGLKTGQSSLSFSTPFGTAPTAALLPVTVPEGRDPSSFRFSLLPPASGTPVQAFDLAYSDDPAAPGVRVTPRLMAQGRYEATLLVEASTDEGTAQAAHYRLAVPLVLDVTASQAEYSFSPAQLTLAVDHGQAWIVPIEVGSVAREGYFGFTGKTYELDQDPPEAAGAALRGQWLSTPGGAWSVSVCTYVGNTLDCLPRGHYKARLHFSHFDAQGQATGLQVDVPVELHVR